MNERVLPRKHDDDMKIKKKQDEIKAQWMAKTPEMRAIEISEIEKILQDLTTKREKIEKIRLEKSLRDLTEEEIMQEKQLGNVSLQYISLKCHYNLLNKLCAP